jgi:hypothetical protein
VGLIVNSGLGTPLGDLRIVRLGGAVLDSLARRPRIFARPTYEPHESPAQRLTRRVGASSVLTMRRIHRHN